MVKVERATTDEDSGSDSDLPQTPLAASTQKSPPKKFESDESEDDQPSSQERPSSPAQVSRTVRDTKEKYLNKFPNVRPSKPKYNVEVDLTDPNDEVWIVRCPKSVNAKSALLNAKLDACQFGEAGHVKLSTKAKQKLEGLVTKNTAKKPVIVMSGTEFKSFVPVGTVQIRDVLPEHVAAPANLPTRQEQLIDEDESVPFPAVIRDRHPMLGLKYKAALKLPKKVKKALSMARQRAEASYLEAAPQSDGQDQDRKPKRKRKRAPTEECLSSDEMIQMLIKQETECVATSPKKRKSSKTVKSEEPAVEDDLSWLHNI